MKKFKQKIRRYIDSFRYRGYMSLRISSLEPGYHELDERMEAALFDALVDFIEVDEASRQYSSLLYSDEYKGVRKLRENKLSFKQWFTWKFFGYLRSEKMGIEYLMWEISLPNICEFNDGKGDHAACGCMSQAHYANEKLELFKWWKYIRPYRFDPSILFSELRKDNISFFDHFDGKLSVAQEEKLTSVCDRVEEMEKSYYEEDTLMLKRLIDIRRGLWT